MPKYQFRIEISYHFNEHGEDRRRWFMFGDDCHRRVPVEMDGVEGLNTIGMFIENPGTFHEGDTCETDCIVIAPELFKPVIKAGTKGRLWDGGYFADVKVLKIYEEGWPENL